jgi:bacterioferritin-associated ferredoxin
MIVCHCFSVSDHAIRRAIREGATCRSEVTRACGAGAGCGGCHGALEDILLCEGLSDPAFSVSLADFAAAR